MIKKRLIRLMADSKRYIIHNVIWQWLALAAAIAAMMMAGRLLQEGFNRSLTGEKLAAGAIVIGFGVLSRSICTRQAARASCLAGNEVKKRLRRVLYEKLTSFGASYHEKVPTAEAVQVAAEGVEQLEVYFGRYLPQLFYSILAPVTLFVALSTISLKASVVLLVCVPLIPLTIIGVQKFARRLLDQYWGVYTELGDSFLENLQGLTTLKIYQADEHKAGEMDREAEHFRKITMKVLMMQLNSIIVMDVVAYGGTAVGMIVALLEYRGGNISLGGAFTIILLSAEFFIPMRMLGSFFHVAMNGMAASDKLFGILDLQGPQPGTKVLADGPVAIQICNLEFAYERSRTILDGISLDLPARGMTALVGESGCGKSTLAALLTGKNRDYRGTIRLNGRSLDELTMDSLMAHVTLVSHNSYLFKGTVAENLRMAAPEASGKILAAVLKEVKLYDFLMGQKGLETELTQRGENLSGGQRQRLALARALLHDSPVYIFDEATSNIDVESENEIMRVIRKLAEERLVLLISHRLANVVEAGRIYVLQDGKIAEQGAHVELLQLNGIYGKLYLGQKALEEYAAAPGAVLAREASDEIKVLPETEAAGEIEVVTEAEAKQKGREDGERKQRRRYA